MDVCGPIEAVVFDVDGVLVRGGAFGERLRSELGLPRSELDDFWRGPFTRCTLGQADLRKEIEPFLEKWGYRGTVEDCLRAWLEADSAVNAEALGQVERLRRRGIPCHVASNQEHQRADYLERTLGFAARFERSFFSCRLGVKKPHPDFFRCVAIELGVSPEALLLFDDQPSNIDAARAAGWRAERYCFGEDLSELLGRYGLVRAH